MSVPDSFLLSIAAPTGSLSSSAAEILADFSVPDLESSLGGISVSQKDIFAEKSRKAWDKSTEARCDFTYRPHITHRAGVWFLSLWKKSVMGRTLSDIKADSDEISRFAVAVARFLNEFIAQELSGGGWCICTTPKRRHKVRNFASLISQEIAMKLNITFHEDVASCKSRQRINAVFTLEFLPPENNIIVFDDFVTTGSTLKAMYELLRPLGKNLLFVAGIDNSL